MEENKPVSQQPQTKKQKIFQFIKFALFSASAGIIQLGSFTLMNEVLANTGFMKTLCENHETFAKIMANDYGPYYLIALILSVIWNFTFNRKFTFKSANNVPIAMLKVFAYYAVFTPVSTIIGTKITGTNPDSQILEYVVLICTMATNMITEFIWDKFVVFREPKEKAAEITEAATEETGIKEITEEDIPETDGTDNTDI